MRAKSRLEFTPRSLARRRKSPAARKKMKKAALRRLAAEPRDERA